MKLSEIKKEQAHSICCALDDLAKVQLDKSKNKTLSFQERKWAIKLAEQYIHRCFRVGNAYKIPFVGDVDYQKEMLSRFFDVTTTTGKPRKKDVVVEEFDWKERLGDSGDSLNE